MLHGKEINSCEKKIISFFFLGVVIGKTERSTLISTNFLIFSKSLAPKYDELAKKLKNEDSIVM